ncbi:hypothetical protein [Treponema pedis]|uniref:hypothetical protein n=1 Tax=Treponema pedis TaxID=409322 RepID=UPI000427C634|nr:hypothetical protein [Treponema pedis]
MKEKFCYYHSAHLGTARFAGLIEETAPGIDNLPFRFTGKELDETNMVVDWRES